MRPQPGQTGISERNFTVRRTEMFGCENIIWAEQNVVIEDNYIHDPIPCCTWPGGSFTRTAFRCLPVEQHHGRGTTPSTAGTSTNRTSGTRPSRQALEQSTNVLVTNNLLAGGGATLRCPVDPGGFTWTNNRFSRVLVKTVGGFGPVDDCAKHTNSGNVYHETGKPLKRG